MKKLFTILLAVAMLASMSVTAFAADDTVTTDGGSKEISVNAKYVDGVSTPDVISADIEWGAMEFTYSVGGVKVWDAQNHQYTVTDATGGWSENGNTVNSVADLAGKTVYATGKASTPEYILNYILSKNGLENVTVEYKTEHSELAALMVSGEVVLGMLPEPNVTTVLTKNSSLRIALNLTEEWKKVSEGESVQGCVVVSKKAIAEHSALVNAFLDEYKASVEFVNSNVADAAAMIAELGIVPAAAIAEKAVPNCNIVYIDSDRMVSVLNVFYKVLFDADPKSVGGTLPDESIFYRR